jgi:hypothetical protein
MKKNPFEMGASFDDEWLSDGYIRINGGKVV